MARHFDLPIPEAREAVQTYLALASIHVLSAPATVSDSVFEAHDRYPCRDPAALTFGDGLA